MAYYDVAIIGGGPAGSSAAYTLSMSGNAVCIIDKCSFPRNKLCGGLLTLRSKKIFDRVFNGNWSEVITNVSRGAKFYSKYTLANSIENYKDIYFTDRYLFDSKLIKLARDAGAHTLFGVNITHIDLVNREIKLDDGRAINYKYLIGCDGVHSLVYKSLFGSNIRTDNQAFALEIDLPKNLVEYSTEYPEIYFGLVHWGYAWIFPKQDHYTVGFGCLVRKNSSLINLFNRFLLHKFGFVPDIKPKGHFLPFGTFLERPGKKNVLLCGDAAGLVDPITGEGIAYAMLSGYYAARSIDVKLKRQTRASAYGIYKSKYDSITRNIRTANKLKYLIFPKFTERLFLKALPMTKGVISLHIDLLSDDIRYSDYLKKILNKIVCRLLQNVFTNK